jgi:hypothetical protein
MVGCVLITTCLVILSIYAKFVHTWIDIDPGQASPHPRAWKVKDGLVGPGRNEPQPQHHMRVRTGAVRFPNTPRSRSWSHTGLTTVSEFERQDCRPLSPLWPSCAESRPGFSHLENIQPWPTAVSECKGDCRSASGKKCRMRHLQVEKIPVHRLHCEEAAMSSVKLK